MDHKVLEISVHSFYTVFSYVTVYVRCNLFALQCESSDMSSITVSFQHGLSRQYSLSTVKICFLNFLFIYSRSYNLRVCVFQSCCQFCCSVFKRSHISRLPRAIRDILGGPNSEATAYFTLCVLDALTKSNNFWQMLPKSTVYDEIACCYFEKICRKHCDSKNN